MSNSLTTKFVPQFKLGTKAVLCAVLLIAMNTALVVGAGYWSLTSAFNERALRDIEVSLRTLALAFAEIVPDARITMRDGAVAPPRRCQATACISRPRSIASLIACERLDLSLIFPLAGRNHRPAVMQLTGREAAERATG